MNSSKRTYSIPKTGIGRYGGKPKDLQYSSSRVKPEGKFIEIESISNIPIIRQSENVRVLPKFTAILGRTSDDGVIMDDLDQLQQDLEKLLSTCAVRTRYLLSELDSIDKADDKRDKTNDKASLKRKRPDEKPKYKDPKTGARIIKKNYGLPVNNMVGEAHLRPEIPKVLPKNDNSDKFWASIEPFCTNVTKDDVVFLDNLIQEFSKEIDIKIPDLGDHYAHEWSDEVVNEEQTLGSSQKTKSNSAIDIKKNGLMAMVDTFSSPQTQRLLASLIEERFLTNFPNVGENIKASDINNLKSKGPRIGICMDRRLKKELVDQGILSVDDLPKNMMDDEIYSEIKKCQQELAAVNEYNVEELNKLRSVVVNDLKKHELKTELDKVDNQILEVYNKILIAKKQVQQADGEQVDKAAFNRQISKEFEEQVDSLLKQQIMLHSQLSEISDAATFY